MRMGKARPAEAFGREEKPAGMFPREEEARDCAGKGPKKGSFCRLAGKKGRSRGSRCLGRLRLPFGRCGNRRGASNGAGGRNCAGKGSFCRLAGKKGRGGGRAAWEGFACRLGVRGNRRGFPGERGAGLCREGAFCRLAGKKGRGGGRAGWEGFACRLGGRGKRRGFPGEKGAGLCREGAFCRFGGEEGAWRGSRWLGRLRLPFGRVREPAGDFQGREAWDSAGKGAFAVSTGKKERGGGRAGWEGFACRLGGRGNRRVDFQRERETGLAPGGEKRRPPGRRAPFAVWGGGIRRARRGCGRGA